MLAEMLTAVSGASECFDGSFVTYANEQKEKLIGVRHETLAKYGAVSYQTALEMSRGARLALGVDIGAGVTGIAGRRRHARKAGRACVHKYKYKGYTLFLSAEP